jgi:signal peptidase II
MQTPPRKGHALSDRGSHLRLWPTAAVAVAVDLGSKYLAWLLLGAPGAGVHSGVHDVIAGWLSLATSENQGIVFGLRFSDNPQVGRIVTILLTLATCALIFYLFSTTRPAQRWVHLACALTMAGAMGNLYDRVVFGFVRDFIQFTGHLDVGEHRLDWPYIFNVADVYLVVGVAALALAYLFGGAAKGEPANPGEPAEKRRGR